MYNIEFKNENLGLSTWVKTSDKDSLFSELYKKLQEKNQKFFAEGYRYRIVAMPPQPYYVESKPGADELWEAQERAEGFPTLKQAIANFDYLVRGRISSYYRIVDYDGRVIKCYCEMCRPEV